MRTIEQRLEAVDAAIEALEVHGVQSYNLGTYSVTKVNLPALYAERRQLMAELENERSDGGIYVGVFRR